jgi:hypothetical protein
MNLTKQEQLQRALNDAARDIVRPPLTLAAISMPLSAAQIADSNLNIVRNKDTGCIQFIFPGHRAPQLDSARFRHGLAGACGPAHTRRNHAGHDRNHGKPQQAGTPAQAGHGLAAAGHGAGSGCRARPQSAADGARHLQQQRRCIQRARARRHAGHAGGSLSGQVYGYDHWTIAKTPQQNALDL